MSPVDKKGGHDVEVNINKVYLAIVNKVWNHEMLESVPHKDVQDLAVAFWHVVEGGTKKKAEFLDNEKMRATGVDLDSLYVQALNFPKGGFQNGLFRWMRSYQLRSW